jgi:hypothetical protein
VFSTHISLRAPMTTWHTPTASDTSCHGLGSHLDPRTFCGRCLTMEADAREKGKRKRRASGPPTPSAHCIGLGWVGVGGGGIGAAAGIGQMLVQTHNVIKGNRISSCWSASAGFHKTTNQSGRLGRSAKAQNCVLTNRNAR